MGHWDRRTDRLVYNAIIINDDHHYFWVKCFGFSGDFVIIIRVRSIARKHLWVYNAGFFVGSPCPVAPYIKKDGILKEHLCLHSLLR